MWWKSKPAFKEFGRVASPQQLKYLNNGKQSNRACYIILSLVVVLICFGVKFFTEFALARKNGNQSGYHYMSCTSFAEKYSFGNILAQYELWVQNVSDITPRIECKAQQMFMSNYQFETDKIENAPKTQGDGGYLEEV